MGGEVRKRQLAWAPQPGPQTALIECPLPLVFFGGARGGGKCLPLTEPVLTPFGWRALGAIEPGMQVCNPNGTVSRVLASYRPGKAPVYRVTFSDGAEAVCDDGHIWLGRFVGHRIKRGHPNRLWRFADVRRKFLEDKEPRFLIPLTSPVRFCRPGVTKHGNTRPVDPYVLGVLLGDGCLTGESIRYATVDDEIDARMAEHGTVRVDEGPNRRLVNAPAVLDGLRKLGLWGKRAHEKSVPEAYKWAGVDERREILRGLMDTDGTADDRGQCYFASSSQSLALDVQWLARSLGYKARIWSKETTHLPCCTVYIQGPDRKELFALSRKRARVEDGQPGCHSRRIVSIVEEGVAEVGCFQVDDPNGLFITRDFVVTHNTDGVLGKYALKEAQFGAGFNAIAFRRTTVSFEDAVERARAILPPLGWRFSMGGNRPQFTSPRGGRLGFRYLERLADADEWQGRNLSDAWVEEAGQYPLPAPIDRLFGVLRSTGGAPPQMILTGNPGGPGQHWLRDRFKLHPFPQRPTRLSIEINSGKIDCAVIPSRITDNRILLEGDPGYIDRLRLVGSEALVRAWLEGDWSAIEGAFFERLDENVHGLEPFEIPEHWLRFRSMDWGYAAPFSVGWWAVASEQKGSIPRGALVRYREWYGASKPGIGLRMDAEEVADQLLLKELDEKISYGVADPAMWSTDSGPSIAERMASRHVHLRPADNRRVGKEGAIGGWDQMRARIRGDDDGPMLFVFRTCKDWWRTVPVLQHDPDKAEDLDTEAEDHAADECFVAGTMIETATGPKPIERVHVGELVETRAGLREVTAVFSVGERQVYEMIASDGASLVGTETHPIFSDGEWVFLAHLRYGSILSPCARQSFSKASSITGILGTRTGTAGSIIGHIANRCIERFGKASTAQSLHRLCSSITRMATRSTTTYPILDSWKRASTPASIGTSESSSTVNANSAASSSAAATWASSGSAATLASRLIAGLRAWMISSASALHATSPITATGTLGASTVPASAHQRANTSVQSTSSIASSVARPASPETGGPSTAQPHVVSVTPAGRRRVYNLTVADAEEYYANGFLVHNCRYACMSRPYVKAAPKVHRMQGELMGNPDGSIRGTIPIKDLIARQDRRLFGRD